MDEETPLGEVFTRRWVVEFILDLVGYTIDQDLASMVAVEPACGTGAFLGPMVERLTASAERYGRSLGSCREAIRAFDLSPENVDFARKAVATQLVDEGTSLTQAKLLATRWVRASDFLLQCPPGLRADFVIGNPPYIRLEDVPQKRSAAYRKACTTMRGRSDIYVGFIEQGLRLLAERGVLGFIVADRWMHNQYGATLRSMVAEGFGVEALIEMHDVDAFEAPVSAYPAVTVIRRSNQGEASLVSTNRGFGPSESTSLSNWILRSKGKSRRTASFTAARLPGWVEGEALWPSGNPESVALVRSLEERFPPLEDEATGTRIRIGVATGADGPYLTRDATAAEPDRLLPIVTSDDTTSGTIHWSGTYLLNPWSAEGLVDLNDYPKLRKQYETHAAILKGRHVARARPATWYRTIDRVWPHLIATPKLLFPDIKSSIHPVLENEGLYPHHNLYFLTSTRWDLEVLGGILLSKISDLFVGTYCVRMRGGCYRFQAQYLRKIRVPSIDLVTPKQQARLRLAFRNRDRGDATTLCMEMFEIEPDAVDWDSNQRR